MTHRDRTPHPAVFALLILPYGAGTGFVTVVLTYFASAAGLKATQVATLTAVWMLPHAWKFLYAPVADTTLDRRRWYLLALAVVVLGTITAGTIPVGAAHFDLLRIVILATSTAAAFLGMAVEGLMAESTRHADRGRVGGWFQAGNLGGAGIGGGIGLMVATAAGPPASALLLAAAFLACGFALRGMPRLAPLGEEGSTVAGMRHVLSDVWRLAKTRPGLLAALLCFLPLSTGASQGVMAQAEVAALWGAGEREVSLVNGLLAGCLMALGSVAGGLAGGRWDSRKVYAGAGLLMAGLVIAWALLPFTPRVFVAMGLAYSLALGLAYAAFSGLVLQVIGGRGVATQYNLFASLANLPITYMGIAMAWVVEHHDARTMLVTEGLATCGSLLLFGAVASLMRQPRGNHRGT